jgi:glycerol-3-phosphate dehydrogenase (NAD(P)+)
VTRVCVLGAGSWGTTLAVLLSARAETTLWSRRREVADEITTRGTNAAYLGSYPLPSTLRVTASLDVALDGATEVIVAVPSVGIRRVAEEGESALGHGAAVLSVAKGLERGSDSRVTEVLGACWPGRPIGVMTGPNLASEILLGQPSASVVAFADLGVSEIFQTLLASDRLRIYTNPDVVGCEIAGVVKNVMAIACGMAIGLGLGDNTRAALITRALAELTRIGVALGGDPRTFSGLAGLGDLVATCTSAKSRNFAVGVELGQGRSLAEVTGASPMVAEGVGSALPTLEIARRLGVEVPIVEQVVAVLGGTRRPDETIAHLMGRSARSEFDEPEEPSGSGPTG